MTLQKKKEVNKYIKYIYIFTGIKFKCRNIKDYIFIKTLYLLLVGYKDTEKEFFEPVINHYANYKDVKDKNYFGYSLHDLINQYLVKYYYSDLTNFSTSWMYYEDLMYNDYVKNVERQLDILDKKIDKNNDRMIMLLDNTIMSAIDYQIKEDFSKASLDSYVIWHTQRDNTVCEECAEHNGKKYYNKFSIPKRHPNCRCWLELIEE